MLSLRRCVASKDSSFLLKRTLLMLMCTVSSTTAIKEESDTASVRAEYCIYMGF